MTPGEKLIDSAAMTPVEKPDNIKDGEAYAIMSGELNIMGKRLRCYILNDGRRIIDADDVAEFFELNT